MCINGETTMLGSSRFFTDESGYTYAHKKSGDMGVNWAMVTKRNVFSRRNIVKYLKDGNYDVELISPLSEVLRAKTTTKLKFRCFKHGYFKRTWEEFLKNGCCSECSLYRRVRSKRMDIKVADDICSNGGFILKQKHYCNNETKVKLECIHHSGEIIYGTIRGVRNGAVRCPSCFEEKRNKRILLKEYKNKSKLTSKILRIESRNGIIYLFVKCKICGRERYQRRQNFFEGEMCPNCKPTSLGEKNVASFLKENKIYYESEKRFDDCKNINTLPFDFYIQSKNTLIEFDGEQHYKLSSGMLVKKRGPKKTLAYIQHNDAIKTKYAKDKGIKLVRIPYYDLKNIDEILTRELNITSPNNL